MSKTEKMYVSLTPNEHKLLMAIAKEKGFKDLSEIVTYAVQQLYEKYCK